MADPALKPDTVVIFEPPDYKPQVVPSRAALVRSLRFAELHADAFRGQLLDLVNEADLFGLRAFLGIPVPLGTERAVYAANIGVAIAEDLVRARLEVGRNPDTPPDGVTEKDLHAALRALAGCRAQVAVALAQVQQERQAPAEVLSALPNERNECNLADMDNPTPSNTEATLALRTSPSWQAERLIGAMRPAAKELTERVTVFMRTVDLASVTGRSMRAFITERFPMLDLLDVAAAEVPAGSGRVTYEVSWALRFSDHRVVYARTSGEDATLQVFDSAGKSVLLAIV